MGLGADEMELTAQQMTLHRKKDCFCCSGYLCLESAAKVRLCLKCIDHSFYLNVTLVFIFSIVLPLLEFSQLCCPGRQSYER
jgi:hypothetical protein